MSPPLDGRIAVVAGATRGAGRGIACMLGETGATVYCTGRSIRGQPASGARPETIEETAELVTKHGGRGIHVQVDHTIPDQVKALFELVGREQGRLDILVNDIWGGDALTEWGKPFWDLELEKGTLMLDRAVNAHIITSRYGVPIMIRQDSGLVIEITDGAGLYYRGNLFYDLAKVTAIRLAYAMAKDLHETNITALAVTPGFLRSEAMLDHFGVTEQNWRDAIKKDPHFCESETPFYVGRAVAALAADANVANKAGKAWSSWKLAREYGFKDVDGRQPHFSDYLTGLVADALSALTHSGRIPSSDKIDNWNHSIADLKKEMHKEFEKIHLVHMLQLVDDSFYDDVLSLGPKPAKDQLYELAELCFKLG